MRLSIITIFCALLVSCVDQDPFGLSTRDISGEFELEQWKDGTSYYLNGPSHLDSGGWGTLKGVVNRLGWSR